MKLTNFKKSIITVAMGLTVVTLSGCGSTDYLKQQNQAKKIGAKITEQVKKDNAVYIDHPPVDLALTIPMDHKKTWTDNIPVRISGIKKTPLSVVLDNISQSTGIEFSYGDQIKRDMPILVNSNGSLSSALSVIEAKTGYDFDVSNRNVITVNAVITKTFPLMRFAGKGSFMIGNESGTDIGGDSDNSETGGVFSADADQYSNIKASDQDPMANIVATVRGIAGGNSTVTANTAIGSITVTGKPINVHRVEDYIKSINKEMGQQVRVDAKIIVFTAKDANSFNVNLDVLKQATDGLLQFTTTASSSAVSGLENLSKFTLKNTKPGSEGLGSSLFIEALRKQGLVSVSTEPSLTVMNNQMGEIQSVHKEAYAKSIAVNSISTTSDSGALASIEQGVVVAGFSMRSLVKVVNDQIMLKLSGVVSEMGDFGNVSYGGTTLKTPQIDENTFNQTVRLLDGETLVLTGYDQDSAKSGKHDAYHNQYLGGNGGRESHTQTMVLITAHLI
ncbi:TPA: type II secretion system protein GspD [Photobacterium damselae]